MQRTATILLLIILFLPFTADAALKVGDRVKAFRVTEIFLSPGVNREGSVLKDQVGTVIGGPVKPRDGSVWLRIDWDNGELGWSNSSNIRLYSIPVVVPPVEVPPPSLDWTTKEILSDIREAEASGDPLTEILPARITTEADSNGFKFIDGQLSFFDSTPPTVTELTNQGDSALSLFLKTNPLTFDMGQCRVPIPEGSLYKAHSGVGTISGTFDKQGTYADFSSTPTRTSFSLGILLDLKAKVDFGLEWCGAVYWPIMCKKSIKNPACPPPLCIPDPRKPWKKKCYTPSCPLPDLCLLPVLKPETIKESWTDWSSFNISGETAANIQISLDHKFVASGTNKIIVEGGKVKLSGGITKLPNVYFTPVRPDTRWIETPIGKIPHVPKSPIMQALIDQANTPLILAQAFDFDEKIVNKAVEKGMAEQEKKINEKLALAGPIEIRMPVFSGTDPDSLELREYVFEYLRNTLGIFADAMVGFVDDNFAEILYFILTDNEEGIQNLFTPEKICPLIANLRQTMPVVPLYKKTGSCEAVDPKKAPSGNYYSDSSCTKSVSFQGGEFNMFCKDALALPNPNKNHGNAAAWKAIGVEEDPLSVISSRASKWSLSAGAQLGIGVEPIKGNSVPYMKRVEYKKAGGCSLEMRIYKKDLNATGLKPLLWIHGGSWSQRGAYLGLEALVSSYTEDGFVVFAPYYRLAGNSDGSIECRNAKWTDVVADTESALDWVKANSNSFGAPNTGKIAVTGQSAGGHLAGWLVAHRPLDVSHAMLIYPPADFGNFLNRMQGVDDLGFFPLGTPTAEDGTTNYSWLEAKSIVESAFGIKDALKEKITSPVVALNSFGTIVKKNGAAAHPPVLIIHGGSDSLLHYSQSVALCEGYGGKVADGWPSLRTTFKCGSSSYLHLIKEANHAFEICPKSTSGVAKDTCLAGSPRSVLLVADSLKLGRKWLLDVRNTPLP